MPKRMKTRRFAGDQLLIVRRIIEQRKATGKSFTIGRAQKPRTRVSAERWCGHTAGDGPAEAARQEGTVS